MIVGSRPSREFSTGVPNYPNNPRMPNILDLCFAQLVRPILASEEIVFMHAIPWPLFGVVAVLLIVAIYFVWGRKLGKS